MFLEVVSTQLKFVTFAERDNTLEVVTKMAKDFFLHAKYVLSQKHSTLFLFLPACLHWHVCFVGNLPLLWLA